VDGVWVDRYLFIFVMMKLDIKFLDCAVSFAVPACPSGKGTQGQRGGKALGSLQANLSYILKLTL
jgi:hypothetical protein